MALADLRALARVRAAPAEAVTRVTRNPSPTGYRGGAQKTEEIRGFPEAVTRVTRVTPKNSNAGGVEAAAARLSGFRSAPDVLADRQAIAAEAPDRVVPPSIPPADMVEALAAALADRAEATPGVGFVGGRETAMAYFRGQARNRLGATSDPMARGLMLGFERRRGGRDAGRERS